MKGEAEVEDIVEDSHYSIEEEKQKAEQDKMKKSAEGLKSEMRQMIERLRNQFRRLLNENDQLPNDLKLARQVNFIQWLTISKNIALFSFRFRILYSMIIFARIFKLS